MAGDRSPSRTLDLYFQTSDAHKRMIERLRKQFGDPVFIDHTVAVPPTEEEKARAESRAGLLAEFFRRTRGA